MYHMWQRGRKLRNYVNLRLRTNVSVSITKWSVLPSVCHNCPTFHVTRSWMYDRGLACSGNDGLELNCRTRSQLGGELDENKSQLWPSTALQCICCCASTCSPPPPRCIPLPQSVHWQKLIQAQLEIQIQIEIQIQK